MATHQDYELDPCRLDIGTRLHAAVAQLGGQPPALSPKDLGRSLEQPPDSKLGDYAFPCFRFAKDLKKKPQDIAQDLKAALSAAVAPGDWIERIEAVGAFLNIFVSKLRMAETVLPEVATGQWFQKLQAGPKARQRVMIEYSQPNTHKEFHVGHGRNVCLGNSLVSLYRYCGYEVTSANYYGDDGTHIATVLWYLEKTGAKAPATGRGEWLGQMYVKSKAELAAASDDERKILYAKISAIHRQIETRTGEVFQLWQETRQWSLDDFHSLYNWLDVKFDVEFFESDVSKEAQEIVDEYEKKGVFALDDGAVGVDLKPYKLGFCILRKRDGNTLYATKDLALARRKFEDFKIDRSIYVVGDEQNHHFRQVFKILELMGFEQAKQCHHLSYGMVVLPEGKMSSRDGTAVSFDSLRKLMLEELHVILKKYEADWPAEEIKETAHRLCDGAIKYGMISTDPAKEIVFDLADWLSFEGNSGPYLMYSYARTQSIIRKAAELSMHPDPKAAAALSAESEHELLRYLYDFNQIVAGAAEAYKPSILAAHLFYMCKAFNRFYADVSVLKAETDALRGARLALTDGFARCLKHGLSLLGIRPPERM